MSSATIESLPNEVLNQIFSCLDSPSGHKERYLFEDPLNLARHILIPRKLQSFPGDFYSKHSLKSLSAVCRRWRDVVLPHLFRHTILCTRAIRRPRPDEKPTPLMQFLDFIKGHDLGHHVQTLTIMRHYVANKAAFTMERARNMARPSAERDSDAYDEVPADFCFPGLQMCTEPFQEIPPLVQDNNWFWDAIFKVVDPLDLILVSSPALILSLLGRNITIRRNRYVMPHYHVVCLSRSSSAGTGRKAGEPGPPAVATASSLDLLPCELFTIRPWERLLINEGSGFDVYKTSCPEEYEYTSLLQPLLNTSDQYLFPLLSNLKAFSYIGIYPHSTTMELLAEHLPPVGTLYVQFTPPGGTEGEDAHLFHPGCRTAGESQLTANLLGSPCPFLTLKLAREMAILHTIALAIGNRGYGNWNGLQRFESKGVEEWGRWHGPDAVNSWMTTTNMFRFEYKGDGVFERVQEDANNQADP